MRARRRGVRVVRIVSVPSRDVTGCLHSSQSCPRHTCHRRSRYWSQHLSPDLALAQQHLLDPLYNSLHHTPTQPCSHSALSFIWKNPLRLTTRVTLSAVRHNEWRQIQLVAALHSFKRLRQKWERSCESE